MQSDASEKRKLIIRKIQKPSQPCPQCGFLIGIIAGSKEAICKNCGFKDPCCE
jgi:predicted RNA-binding Zn-ribbon protein involved in translation (DUF1610 family)